MLRIVLILLLTSTMLHSQDFPKKKLLKRKAPETFKVKFTTTKGDFVVEAHRDWAPLGVDRLYQLVVSGFYTDIAVFRVQPEYVVQFGIAGNPELNKAWEFYTLEDEPVGTSNLKGTVAFARGGPNTRTTQLFVNVADNFKLDTIAFNGLTGFPPIAKVIEGMEVVHNFHSGYGRAPVEDQGAMYEKGEAYLKEVYPELDYILKAEVVK